MLLTHCGPVSGDRHGQAPPAPPAHSATGWLRHKCVLVQTSGCCQCVFIYKYLAMCVSATLLCARTRQPAQYAELVVILREDTNLLFSTYKSGRRSGTSSSFELLFRLLSPPALALAFVVGVAHGEASERCCRCCRCCLCCRWARVRSLGRGANPFAGMFSAATAARMPARTPSRDNFAAMR